MILNFVTFCGEGRNLALLLNAFGNYVDFDGHEQFGLDLNALLPVPQEVADDTVCALLSWRYDHWGMVDNCKEGIICKQLSTHLEIAFKSHGIPGSAMEAIAEKFGLEIMLWADMGTQIVEHTYGDMTSMKIAV